MNPLEIPHAASRERLARGNGDIARANFDWSETPLGSPENWSHQLRAAVAAALAGTAQAPTDTPPRSTAGDSLGLDRAGSNTPFMIARYGRDLRCRYASAPYAEMFGREPEDLIGLHLLEILGTVGFERVRPHVEAVLAGRTATFDAQIETPANGRRHLRAIYRPDRNEQGEIIGWLASVLDRSDQVKAESAAQRINAVRSEIESVLENMVDGFIAIDGDWRVTYVNAAAEKAIGRKRTELVGQIVWELLPDSVRTLAETEYRRAMEHRVPVKFEAQSGPQGRWFEHEGHPTPNGGLAIYGRDITARRETAAARKASEEEFRAFFELAAVGAVQIDATTKKYVRVNRRFCELTGYSADELAQLSFLDLMHSDDRPASEAGFRRLLEGETPELTIERRLRRKDGRWIWTHVTKSMSRGSDGSIRAVAVVQDITERRAVEEARRSSEAQLSAIFAHAAAGLSEISLEGKFERVNEELCRMLGRPADALVGCSVLEATHPDDAVKTITAVGTVIATGNPASLDKRYVQPSGTVVWANSILTRLDDEIGRPRALLAVSVDLTQRMRAEEALRTSEERFRGLAEASSHVLFRMNADWSEMRQLRGGGFIADTEQPARNWVETYIHPDDQPHVKEAIQHSVATGAVFELEHRVRRVDGTLGWTLSRAVPVRDAAGTIMEWFGAASDITERRVAQEALRDSVERLRRAREIETVGIVYFRPGGAITDANEAFLRMSGYDRADLNGGLLRWDTMTPPEWMPASLKAMGEFAAMGRTVPYEKELFRRDGTRWWGLFAASRLSDDEGVEYVIDVTERKEAEAELRASREDLEMRVQERTAELDAVNGVLRDEIVERERAEQTRQELMRQLVVAQEDERRRISRELHDEVGQDLTALLLGLRSLEGEQGEAKRRALEQLQRITERIGREVHEMALKLRPTALDDLGLLRTLSNYVDEWAGRSGVEVDFHSSGWTGERLPPHVETTIYRIVQEALNNVLKHAKATQVSVIVERRTDQAVAIVEDNGVGFDVASVEKNTGAKRLGLLGMRERAALIGGQFSIESSEQRGTTVFVRIPLRPAARGQLS